ncbi:MAG: MBL fold metallo-hydrolase [Actinomycetes bacterium]
MLPDVTFLGHATLLVEMAGVRILTDPVLFSRVSFLGRVVPPLDPVCYQNIDIVLISHMHQDHCDLRSLRELAGATLIVPPGAGSYLQHKSHMHTVELPVGATISHAGVQVRAVKAVHDASRVPFGPHAESIGFLITSADCAVYFAGDTDVYPEMAEFTGRAGQQIDVALLPVWGWGPNLGPGHMNPERAVQAINLIEPRFSVPIHWGTLFPLGLGRVKPSLRQTLVRPPLEFAQRAELVDAPGAVVVVQPGNPVVFPR